MTREEAYELMCEMIKSPNLRKHALAVEAIMIALCRELRERHPEPALKGVARSLQERLVSGSDKKTLNQVLHSNYFVEQGDNEEKDEFDGEEWGIVGLLHDADYELVEKDPKRHTLVTEEKLRPLGVSERIINGIKAHHDGIKEGRDNFLEKAVYAADELSGLITAVALVRPDKKLASVSVESVMKKFPEKSFAAGAKRDQILACEKELDIPLEEFVKIGLEAMQKISDQLGL